MLGSTNLVIGSYCKIIDLAHALSNRFHLQRGKSHTQIVVFNAQDRTPLGIVHLTHESDYVLLGHANTYLRMNLDMKFVQQCSITG